MGQNGVGRSKDGVKRGMKQLRSRVTGGFREEKDSTAHSGDRSATYGQRSLCPQHLKNTAKAGGCDFTLGVAGIPQTGGHWFCHSTGVGIFP